MTPRHRYTESEVAELHELLTEAAGKYFSRTRSTLLRRLASDLPAMVQAMEDKARLDWLEAHERHVLCNGHVGVKALAWGVSGPPSIEGSDDYEGKTLRDAIDWAIKSESRAARSQEGSR